MELCRSVRALLTFPTKYTEVPLIFGVQTRCYAARKGTREKAKKKKVKLEVKKIGFIPHNLRDKPGAHASKRILDDTKPESLDDVFFASQHQRVFHSFANAVDFHREILHPEMFGVVDAPLHAFVELDMRGVKKTKFIDSFSRVTEAPHPFDHGEDRSVLAFCKTEELKDAATENGAALVGDVDLIKKIEKGELVLPDFQFILAHPNILPELVCLRGLLKKKFPNPKQRTLGIDMGKMVRTFRTGIQYNAVRDERELDYGFVDVSIGPLNMEKAHLEANFKALLVDIESHRPKRPGPFITKALLKCVPSPERFFIDLKPYIESDFEKDEYESDSDDEPEEQKVSQ